MGRASFCVFPSSRKAFMGLPANSHVVIFPFMFHSHTLPMIDLAKGFCLQQVRVSIVTIPSNSKHISPKIQGLPLISLVELPLPQMDALSEVNHLENLSGIPSMEFFVSFLTTSTHLHNPFQQLLQSMATAGDLPLCVVSDHFLGWTLETCRQFGVPRLVFHATGIVPLLINKTIMANSNYTATSSSHMTDTVRRLLPDLPFDPDVPEINIPPNSDTNPFVKFMAEANEADSKSWGVFSNTFLELESDYKSALESFYVNGAKAWCLGPSFLYGRQTKASSIKNTNNQDDEYVSLMKWLDARAEAVIYVAFGSLTTLTEAQLEALALGLEESGHPYVLVIRSSTWCAPKGVGSKGVIARGFIDQVEVLCHKAIGGFLSHCGWNSMIESLAAEVPILAWPIMPDHKMNAKYVVEGLRIGIWIEKGENQDLIYSQDNISASVRELMIGEKGKKARERAGELGNLARRAVEDGGSSHENMKTLLHELVALRSKKCEFTEYHSPKSNP